MQRDYIRIQRKKRGVRMEHITMLSNALLVIVGAVVAIIAFRGGFMDAVDRHHAFYDGIRAERCASWGADIDPKLAPYCDGLMEINGD